jgi:hypothetical protein
MEYSSARPRQRPPYVQSLATRIPMEMHNSFEKQESIHRDATRSEFSLVTCRVWIVLCLSIASIAICLRRKRAEVTNFSTWGVLTTKTK